MVHQTMVNGSKLGNKVDYYGHDRNGDGKIQYATGAAFDGKGKPAFDGENRAENGERLTTNGKGPAAERIS